MRRIHDHKVSPANDLIEIEVLESLWPGGATHQYAVHIPHYPSTFISFQNGPIGDVGVNGLTLEVLIAICIDRLRSFQAEPLACRENALALTKLEEAQQWLHSRTLARMRRNVEGTHTV